MNEQKDDFIAREELSQAFIKIRLSLIEYAITHTLAELLAQSLDEVAAFVESPIGFYHFVEPQTRKLFLCSNGLHVHVKNFVELR